jgi:hypothetical protein
MSPRLKQFLNHSILVSIPALFEEAKCRLCSLRLVEPGGLWLSSDELTARLMPVVDRSAAGSAPAVFVPAGQIAAVVLPSPPMPEVQPVPAARPGSPAARRGDTGPAATPPEARPPTRAKDRRPPARAKDRRGATEVRRKQN